MPDLDSLGYVRLLISDTDGAVFSDNEVMAVMAREAGEKLAAARLLEIIADNESLIAKSIRSQDFATDGPKVAADLRRSAAQLRAEATAEAEAVAEEADPYGGIAVVDYAPYGYRKPELVPWYVGG
jgi:hypothetical protein